MILNIANVAKSEHSKKLYKELKDTADSSDLYESRKYDAGAFEAFKQRVQRNRATKRTQNK